MTGPYLLDKYEQIDADYFFGLVSLNDDSVYKDWCSKWMFLKSQCHSLILISHNKNAGLKFNTCPRGSAPE